MKIFALALMLAIAGFGQTLDSIGGGKFELRGNIDRPVFVNHSGQTVIYVTVIQQYAGGARGINRWFLGVAPETVVPDGTERELSWSEARRAVRIDIDPGDEKTGAISPVQMYKGLGVPKSLTLDFVATISGEFFGNDSLGSYNILLSRLKVIHDAAEIAAAGNWDPIDSDLESYRWIRPASLERRKAMVDHYRSLPVRLLRAE